MNTPVPAPATAPVKILMVDDNPSRLLSYRAILDPLKFTAEHFQRELIQTMSGGVVQSDRASWYPAITRASSCCGESVQFKLWLLQLTMPEQRSTTKTLYRQCRRLC